MTGSSKKVTIFNVGRPELNKLREKFELSTGLTETVTVIFNGKLRNAWIVDALKEGVTLGDEDEDKDEGKDEDKEEDKERSVPT